jgi:hypothetical protein
LDSAKRSERSRKPEFIVAHVHEAHPEFKSGKKTASIMLNVRYALLTAAFAVGQLCIS